MQPGERLRRGLRGRRPRAQAARAPARARHRPLEGAARARRASRRPRRARRSPTSDLPYPLLVDDDGRPLGWLSERELAGERVTDELRSRPSPCSSSTTCCATRSPTCSQHGDAVRAGRGRARRASPACSRSRSSATPSRPTRNRCRRRRRVERTTDDRSCSPRSRSTTAPTDSCVSDNGFCPGWIVDNFDRYVDPLLPARAPDAWSPSRSASRSRSRSRWSPTGGAGWSARSPRSPAILYTLPSLAVVLPAAADHRPRQHDGDHRARRLHAADHLPQHHHRARQRARRRRKDAGRGMGLTDRQLLWRVELPLALPEIMAGLRIAATTTVGPGDARRSSPGAGGLGEQIFADITFKSNVVAAGGLAVLLAAALDVLILLVAARAHPLDAGAGGMTTTFAVLASSATRSTSSSTRASRRPRAPRSAARQFLRPHLGAPASSAFAAMAIACAIADPARASGSGTSARAASSRSASRTSAARCRASR